MKACFRAAVVVILLGLLATGSAWAQGTGSLTGTVSDPTGAVVPGADVKLTSETTGLTRDTTTASNGVYVFPLLPPATYKVEVSAQGFKTAVREHLAIQVGLPSTFDVRLELGAIAETVEVAASAAPLNTQDASIGIPFSGLQIRQLPLEARNVVGLLSLQPGAVFVPTGDMRSGSISGSRSDQSNITLDGVDINDPQGQTAAYQGMLRTTLDSVQEFRVTTTNYGADQGRSSAAQVQLITKSGTNELHGSVYWYHRNTATSSNEYFNNIAAIKTPRLNKHIYGASAGGPLKKDRFFIFGNYEARRESSEDPVNRAVPSISLRDGILIYQCTNLAGFPACPTTQTTVRGFTTTHTIPAGYFGATPAQLAAIDPLGIGPSAAASDHFRQYPVPNQPGRDGIAGTTTGNIVGFLFNSPIEDELHTYILRADFKIDARGNHTAFWRGNLQDDKFGGVAQFPGQPPNSKTLVNSKGFALGYDAVLKPNVVNSFRWGYTRIKSETAGLRSSHRAVFRFIDALPSLSSSSGRVVPTQNLRDDLTWTTGPHSVQFGFNIRYSRIPRFTNAISFHTASANGSWVSGIGANYRPGDCTDPGCTAVPAVNPAAGAIWADTWVNILGLLSQASARYNYDKKGNVIAPGTPIARRYGSDEYEWYVQDTWRLRPTLTLTLGVRYSAFSPPWETNGNQVAPTPGFSQINRARETGMYQGIPSNAHGLIRVDLAGPANDRPGFYPWDLNNWAPRGSLAWNPHFTEGVLGWLLGDGKTALRLGYSLVYDRIGQALATQFDTVGSFGLSTSLSSPFGVNNEDTPGIRYVNATTMPRHLPAAPPAGFPQTPPTEAGVITSSIDDGITTPYSHMYNFSIGRELPGDLSLEVAYVGRQGRHLLTKRDLTMPLNLVDPATGMDYFTAARLVIGAARTLPRTGPFTGIAPIPYWENLFPDAAGTTPGLTATQAVARRFRRDAPDYITSLWLMDQFCFPACSTYGPFAYFNIQYDSLAGQSSIGFSEYHSLQLSLRKRYSHGSQFDFNYTFSKSLDMTSEVERGSSFSSFGAGGYSNFIINTWNPRAQYAQSDFDLRHQINANGLYELPFGRGKWLGGGLPGWANHIVGGWQVSGLFRWTSAFPFNVINCRSCWPTNWNLQGNGELFGSDVPETATTRNAVGGRPSPFKDAASARLKFRRALPGEVGIRNLLRGDGFFTIDFGLAKWFSMPIEGHRLQFRWETFNVTNTPTFNVADLTAVPDIAASFGRYNSTMSACDGRAGRCMQFALRYEF